MVCPTGPGVQQQRGPRQRPGAAAAGQPEREGLPGAGRRGAPARAHHDQRRGAGADEEPLHAAVPDHEPEEPRLPGDCRQHGQRGLQHELHLSDSRVKTEIAEADVAELLQLFDRGGQAVQAPGHERGPEAGLCLGRLRRNKVEEFDSTTHTSPACCGGCARVSRPGWTHLKPGRRSGGRRTSSVSRPRFRGALLKLLFGARSRCVQAFRHPGNLAHLFWGNK